MSDRKPLMPKATAVWLVENTSLSFEQIAAFCGLHVLEVKGIADGDVAQGIKGLDPVTSGQLTRDEIAAAEEDPAHELQIAEPKVHMPEAAAKKGPRYTPVSRRHDRPNAVLWLLRNHPELKNSQIMRLVGTTKPTITQIRERSHWNAPNLTPQDPVTLGPFAALGWAGGRSPVDAWRPDGGVRPVIGVAAELLFGLVRIEAGWALRSGRIGIVVDAAPGWWPIL